MTETDELCRLLDERGVEYERTAWSCGSAVWWEDASGVTWRAHDNEEDELLSLYAYSSVTPEQAIAATLGSSNCTNSERTGTCHVETTENWLPAERYHRCKHCGAFFAVLDASGDIPPKVCPNCGRRIVQVVDA